MARRILPLFLVSLACLTFAGAPSRADAQVDLAGYLPADVDYDPAVPVPSSVLGFEVGEWHVRHDQLVAYLRRLAAASERVEIETVGRSHEGRPLVQLTVSAPENLARLDRILEEHARLVDPEAETPDTAEMPVVVYLGYSIHGNESSGANASMLVAYHLAAARGTAVEALLADAVVVVDPSLNPDGLARFAGWANMHRGRVLVADPQHREHREGWPSGRTNHYWFDLNRDWLLAQHPESQARLDRFHRLHPNVQADFHEMGTDSTYFFQPGVPSRQNPLTPARNLELTRELAAYHARALDRAGSLYYSEEQFDDFYFGKGSTYPDLHGAVGILFEQASARGHLQESANGPLSFPFTIRNQFLTSLSTLEGALAKRRELLDYQADFYRSAVEEASEGELRGYLFGDPADPARVEALLELLLRHRVEVHRLAESVEVGGQRFAAGEAFVVPARQRQYRLVRALFERRVDFPDTTFYDVSTWTLPLAFGVPYAALDRGSFRSRLLGEEVAADGVVGAGPPAGSMPDADAGDVYAYLFPWDGYYAPRTLHRLLAAGVRARVATRPFTAETSGGPVAFDRGTVVVPMGIQEVAREAVRELFEIAAERDGVTVHAAASGLTPEGIDLGSPSLRPLERPRPAILVGRGVGAYEAGEVWHLLDHRFHLPVSLLEVETFEGVELDRYSHLILPDGDYRGLPDAVAEKLRGWVTGGGVLVALQGATVWTREHVFDPQNHGEIPTADRPEDPERPAEPRITTPPEAGEKPERRPYGDYRDEREEQLIGGAIFEVDLDLTHPLAYGYPRPRLPVFRNSRIFLEPQANPYTTVAAYTDAPLLSGYVSTENYARLQGTPAVIVDRLGDGTIVRMVDNPNFRAFWYGTNKLLLNALFFAPIVEATPPVD